MQFVKYLKLRSLLYMTALVCVSAFSAYADTKPDDHASPSAQTFLNEGDAAHSQYLLPPPPEPGSILFLYDKERYDWGRLQRNTPRGDQAYIDANVQGNGVAELFSEAFGIAINEQNTPQTLKLIVRMREDAGSLATREAKTHFQRTRPFVFFNEATCDQEHQASLAPNHSYPSGHSAIGWATALVLAELNPERQNEILKRGYEIGQSRVICGYHYQSDVDAARIVAAGVVARLHANKEFRQQLDKAREEIDALQKKGLIKKSDLAF